MGGCVPLSMRVPEARVAQPAPGPPTPVVCFGERQGRALCFPFGQPAGRLPEPLFLEGRAHCVVWAPAPPLVLNQDLHKYMSMPFEPEQLTRIFNRTSDYCHICREKLCRHNYGDDLDRLNS